MADYHPQAALLVVDVQNDFSSPQGSLYVPGGEEVVPRLNEEIAAARHAGAFVTYTQDW
ncbi:MAG: isochorismatase family protein, partial [Acidobacteria bacterium]|nr:isochorismatase family protein [Acidobacteriota bacterium]